MRRRKKRGGRKRKGDGRLMRVSGQCMGRMTEKYWIAETEVVGKMAGYGIEQGTHRCGRSFPTRRSSDVRRPLDVRVGRKMGKVANKNWVWERDEPPGLLVGAENG